MKTMAAVLSPRQSAQLIARHAKHVKIVEAGVKNVAKLIYEDLLKCQSRNDCNAVADRWKQHELHPKNADDKAVDWIFVVDTLNFSFWSPGETSTKYQVHYKGNMYTGYWSLCAAINRAIEEGIPISDPLYYANVDQVTFCHIFRSDSGVEIPLLNERYDILRETGQTLISKFGGSFVNCIKKCGQSAEKLLQLVVENFPSYRDEATFQGQNVSFYKRGQILIGDLWACFGGKSYGAFTDIKSITMFADYRIPQVLVYFKALSYSDELMKKLKEGHLFQSGDLEEVEIRGCTIWCVEQICEEMRRMHDGDDENINAIMVDHFLWDYRRDHCQETDAIPFHRVRTIYY